MRHNNYCVNDTKENNKERSKEHFSSLYGPAGHMKITRYSNRYMSPRRRQFDDFAATWRMLLKRRRRRLRCRFGHFQWPRGIHAGVSSVL